MVKNQKTLKALLLSMLVFSTASQAEENFSFGKGVVGDIEAMAPLPAEGFNLIQANGRLLLVSKDGHYAIKGGRILDAWHGFEIKTVGDLERSKRVPKKFRTLPWNQMGVITFGKEKADEILAFLDPTTSKGQPIISQLVGLSSNYLIRIVPLPATDERAVTVERMLCLKSIDQMRYLKGEAVELPKRGSCDKGPLMRNVVTAMALRIKQLPRVVAPNGSAKSGAFDIADFVNQNRK
jgi:thiol:disulfide interchange protein DsbC